MNRMKIAILLLLLISCYGLCANDNPNIESPLNLSVQTPAGKGPFPSVVICPGRGYHMDRPLIKNLADQAVKEGFAAIRFNWTFFMQGTEPSNDGQQELNDIEAVLRQMKQMPVIDTTRIYMAGKSLGSMYAYAVFRDHAEVKGCLLLTPIIPDSTAGADYYPDLQNELRKVVFVLGNEDYYNCRVNNLYSYLAKCKASIPVVVLAGAHSFDQAGQSTDKNLIAIDEYNLQQAMNTSIYWLKTFENPN
ncbi:MAG: hypothetical protein PHO32_01180 [Candidatus Cloacimonetes bacterium]|nr:hypothetical protein [Candidatus Cloacimonadota bacterium]